MAEQYTFYHKNVHRRRKMLKVGGGGKYNRARENFATTPIGCCFAARPLLARLSWLCKTRNVW